VARVWAAFGGTRPPAFLQKRLYDVENKGMRTQKEAPKEQRVHKMLKTKEWLVNITYIMIEEGR
jgi:hypothetical protein